MLAGLPHPASGNGRTSAYPLFHSLGESPVVLWGQSLDCCFLWNNCNSESVLNSHTTPHLYSAGLGDGSYLINSQVPLSIPYMSKTLLRVLHHSYEGGCRWARGTWRLKNVVIMIFIMYSIELGTWCAFSKDLWSRYLNLHVEILP